MKPTNVNNVYLLSGMAPPAIIRDPIVKKGRDKRASSNKQLHGHIRPGKWIKPRKSLMSSVEPLIETSYHMRLSTWTEHLKCVPDQLLGTLLVLLGID